MRALTTLLLLALALPLPAAAVDPLAARIADAVDISVEEWSAMATGRTLTYRIEGNFFALEHYYPGTNRVTLQLADGECLEGTWEYTAPHYCFFWEDGLPACFRHARIDGAILIIQTENGEDTPVVQRMTEVTDVSLICGPAVTS